MKSIETKRERYFQTDNLQLASYLFAKGIDLHRVEKSGRFGIFHFSAKEALGEIEKYTAGKALIEPRSYSRAFRELRFKVDKVQDEDGSIRTS